MIEKQIHEAYRFLRENNHTVPDEVLEFIKTAALEALKKDSDNQKWKYLFVTEDGHYYKGQSVSEDDWDSVDDGILDVLDTETMTLLVRGKQPYEIEEYLPSSPESDPRI